MAIQDLIQRRQSNFAAKQDKFFEIEAVIVEVNSTVWFDQTKRLCWVQNLDGTGSPYAAYNRSIAAVVNTPVKLRVEEGVPYPIVIDIAQSVIATVSSALIGTHHTDHEPGGTDMMWLYAKAFLPLALLPGSTGLTVTVVAGYVEINGTWQLYAGAIDHDISSAQPSSGNHRLVGFYLDSSGALGTVNGTAVATATIASDPTWPDGATPLGVYDLDGDQTTSAFSDIDNRRAFVTSGVKHKLNATAAPTTGDDDADGYSAGSMWVDVTNDTAHICLDASTGAAVWQELGAFTGPGSSTDNAIVRWDGTGGNTLQNTGVTIDDNNKLTLPNSATYPPLNVTERSSAPSTPASGDIYLDDGTNTASGIPGWRRYTGSAWEDVSAAGGGGLSTLTVRNNSGATATAGDCGYLVGRDYYLGTAGNPSQRCIVVTGGSDGASIEVQNRGNVTATYTGSAPSAGDYLKYDSIGALTIDGSTPTRDTIAAATAAGSGGSVAVLLMTPGDRADLFLRGDQAGVRERFVDVFQTWETHLDSGAPAGYSLQTYSPFTTANLTQTYAKSKLKEYFTSGTVPLYSFFAKSSSSKTYKARCKATLGSMAGIRLDIGSNTNYVTLFLQHNTTTNLLDLKYQTHTAGPTTLVTGLPPMMYTLYITSAFSIWVYRYGVDDDELLQVGTTGSADFTPTLNGIFYSNYNGGGVNQLYAGIFEAFG